MKKLMNASSIKILFILVFVYSLVVLFSPKIFIANTPRFNPVFISSIKKTPANFIAFVKDPLGTNSIPNIRKKNAPLFVEMKREVPSKNWVFKTVQKGIQVATDPLTKQSYAVFDDKVKYKTIDLEINGQKYKAVVPQ